MSEGEVGDFPWLESTLRGGEANFPFDIGSKRDF
jgi:hypothetical protein